MKQQIKQILIIGLLLIGSSSAANAYIIDGIPESGPMNFYFDEANSPAGSLKEALWKIANNRIELSQPLAGSGITLFRAINAGHFVFTDIDYNTFDGTKGNFELLAYFGADGNFTNGSVVITGAIAGIGITSPEVLMTADITGFGTENGLVGFATGNVSCNPVYAALCFLNESVYLETSLSTGNDGLGSLNNSAINSVLTASLTTVPVPASIWLLLSGLGALLSLNRRKAA